MGCDSERVWSASALLMPSGEPLDSSTLTVVDIYSKESCNGIRDVQ
jgi:hypothetical protein